MCSAWACAIKSCLATDPMHPLSHLPARSPRDKSVDTCQDTALQLLSLPFQSSSISPSSRRPCHATSYEAFLNCGSIRTCRNAQVSFWSAGHSDSHLTVALQAFPYLSCLGAPFACTTPPAERTVRLLSDWLLGPRQKLCYTLVSLNATALALSSC